MGTRADFYIGRGENAEWLGSIAWDGYPEGIDIDVLRSTSPVTFKANLERFFSTRDDVTLPERGWPWPWEDSRTTDYAYALDDGKVWASCFGREWFDPQDREAAHGGGHRVAVFPDMSARMNMRRDIGSGAIFL